METGLLLSAVERKTDDVGKPAAKGVGRTYALFSIYVPTYGYVRLRRAFDFADDDVETWRAFSRSERGGPRVSLASLARILRINLDRFSGKKRRSLGDSS